MIIAPVKEKFRVTQVFGVNPKTYERFGLKAHNGLDIGTPIGTPVYACFDGILTVGNDYNDGYGKYIKITEEFGSDRRQVILGHLSRIKFRSGTKVRAGELVGETGNTGFSSGPHLHITMKRVDQYGNVKNRDNGYSGSEDIYGKGWILQYEPSKY